MNPQKLAKLQAGVRIGGPGSMRRKHKAKRNRNVTSDEKRLISTLKRIGVQQIPGIEEINMFKLDGTVIHFKNPKFQASGTANTYVVSGRAEHKNLKDLLPGILDQLPTGGMGGGGGGASMQHLAEALKTGLGGSPGAFPDVGGDDDIPDLVENFGEETASTSVESEKKEEKKVEEVKAEKKEEKKVEEVKTEAKEEKKVEEIKVEAEKKEEPKVEEIKVEEKKLEEEKKEEKKLEEEIKVEEKKLEEERKEETKLEAQVERAKEEVAAVTAEVRAEEKKVEEEKKAQES